MNLENTSVREKALRRIFDEHFDAVSRTLRRLGVDADAAEDAAQKVFWIASGKLGCITPGLEKAYLRGIAARVASDTRKARARQSRFRVIVEEQVDDTVPSIEELIDLKRTRALVARLLDKLPDEQRVVFVMMEGEGLSKQEISRLLGIPMGTVASRLRLARATLYAQLRVARRTI